MRPCILLILWMITAVEMEEQKILQSLHCPPCERIHCSPRRALKLQCRGGITTGICGCCPVCAKLAGENCGGTWDYLGKCDEGLVCIHEEAADGKAEAELKGTCKSVLEVLKGDTCRPECTWEYCKANPNDICSARSVLLMEKRECGGQCQHTTCSSCLLLRPPPCSQPCSPTDHACLHRFGRCVRGHLTEDRHPPVCHHNLQNNSEGFFMCLAPACPSTAK
ncbi:IGFBP domain-containing protein precursor [Danio rerio]|uniref:IGFBP domain-containing protein precursor n=1 Tax=Danio rerio TaxID=7955 RepID=X1WGX6_DANRE|nr:IGFBP domain-containing protein precursor [Danio rerio]|eukprot:XP_002666955.1 cysteine-rich motor neuron 1 protein-like [Danio rerio]